LLKPVPVMTVLVLPFALPEVTLGESTLSPEVVRVVERHQGRVLSGAARRPVNGRRTRYT
jgi:hypothetical protein